MTETKTLYAAYAALIEKCADRSGCRRRVACGNQLRQCPRWSRRATHLTAILLPMPRWCWPKGAGTNPRALAEAITAKFSSYPAITSAEIAGPGFLNLRLAPDAWLAELQAIAALGDQYGRFADRRRPQGQRGICLGQPDRPECIWAIAAAQWWGMRWRGCSNGPDTKVIREYYINDAGGQVDVLARSVHLRYLEALGAEIGEIPAGLYPGAYLKPVGEALAAENWGRAVPRFARGRMAADLPCRGGHADDGPESSPISRCSAFITMSFPPRPRCRRQASPKPPRRGCARMNLVYDGVLEAPKGKAPPEDWEPVTLPLFRSTEVRRRSGSPDQEVEWRVDLFRCGPRLSHAEGRNRR